MGDGRGKIVFILGGARSGKSGFALEAASGISGRKAFIATAQALDPEMRERIARHKAERSDDWDTFEEAINLHCLVPELNESYDVLLIDCLTLWITNLMLSGCNIEESISKTIEALSSCRSSVLIVSNEVGLGIVPENRMAREFRDIAGTLNRKIASLADEVYFVAAGLPVKIKPQC